MLTNVCFLITVVMRYVEIGKQVPDGERLIPLPFVQGVLVILGYGAIFVNILFVFVWLMIRMTPKKYLAIVPHLIWILIFLVLQLLYFFTPEWWI